MISLPVGEFVIVILIFLRIISTFISAPIYGQLVVPILIKIFLSMIVAYIIFLTIDKSNIVVETNIIWLMTNGIKEIITGLIIGFMLNIVFHGISYAGNLIGYDMQLSMASSLNPFDATSNNDIGQILFFGIVLIFILINGHYYIISALIYSFSVVHIGKFSISEPAFLLLVKYTGTVFVIAFKIASPIIVSYFLVYLAEGIMTKVIPQMQIFFVSQPLIIGIGFVLLAGLMPVYVYVMKFLLEDYENKLTLLIKAMGQ
ncbi:MAG TPA: flagellar biosynthetic protein FliR [Ignavibacteria bacterium]|nr:flagellar biosynthetic protein FliR [Ignavibacteria bacterium]